MQSWLFVLTVLAALGSGLMAGLFFAFSAFIMQAFATRPAAVGIAAMQSINETILNPVFFLLFFGTAVLSLILAILAVIGSDDAGSGWRLAGGLLYLIGAIGITMRWNVPLNNGLAQVMPESPEGAAVWARYLKVWTRWNHVRTVACLAATASFILGMR
ncbi:DUF1772 domain-containing protein [Dongia sp.]|uniref:anthrone oxygenase family protein n=1 Tax=Dongia sp. TaxID=1977262 RepID=UPI003751AFD1